MKFAKFSKELTKKAGFSDSRSKIGLRADGTKRYDLAGKDKESLRSDVFARDSFLCVDLNEIWNDGTLSQCSGPLELSHWPPMSKSGGSDEMATCFCRCQKHHRLLDNNQVRWSKRVST